jgi:hypothetical protein
VVANNTFSEQDVIDALFPYGGVLFQNNTLIFDPKKTEEYVRVRHGKGFVIVYVKDKWGNPIEGVTITLKDTFGGKILLFSRLERVITNKAGGVEFLIPVEYEILNSGERINYTPYTLTVEKEGYERAVIKTSFENRTVTVILKKITKDEWYYVLRVFSIIAICILIVVGFIAWTKLIKKLRKARGKF